MSGGLETTMYRMEVSRGRRYGFMQPAIETPQGAKRYSATGIPCPDCGVPADKLCPGPRICAARMAKALALARTGGLEELPEDATIVVEQCQACGDEKHRTQRDTPRACSPEHRCTAGTPGGRCTAPRVLPGPKCMAHTPPNKKPRWTDGVLGRRAGSLPS